MRIKTLKIKNFRGYKEEVIIDFANLTAFVGKNDVGKSTVLDALEIFFNDNKGIVKLEKGDVNKEASLSGDMETILTVCFEEFPEKIIIDATYETTLQSQYLLNSSGQLEIVKKYTNAGVAKVFVRAHHPTNPLCNDLLLKGDKDLRAIIDRDNIPCPDKSTNAIMRTSI